MLARVLSKLTVRVITGLLVLTSRTIWKPSSNYRTATYIKKYVKKKQKKKVVKLIAFLLGAAKRTVQSS